MSWEAEFTKDDFLKIRKSLRDFCRRRNNFPEFVIEDFISFYLLEMVEKNMKGLCTFHVYCKFLFETYGKPKSERNKFESSLLQASEIREDDLPTNSYIENIIDFKKVISVLDSSEKLCVTRRYVEDWTLEEMAKAEGKSRTYEKNKVKKILNKIVNEIGDIRC